MSGREHLGPRVIAWTATGDDVHLLYIGCQEPELPENWASMPACAGLVERLLQGGGKLGTPVVSDYEQPNTVDAFFNPVPIFNYVFEVGRE